MTVCIVDTSVFCELLEVPNLASRSKQAAAEFKAKLDAEESFYLPLVTVLETGNHIGQNGNGSLRRLTAQRFAMRVQQALAGESPFLFIGTPPEKLTEALLEFPDWVRQKSGLGDLNIKKAWEDLATRHRFRRVYVWSFDRHLASYDTGDR